MLNHIHCQAIVKLMHMAKLHIDYPKIRLQSDDLTIQLSVAGSKSLKPNCINITDGRPYGSNTFYGRIWVDGTLKFNTSIQKQRIEIISHELELFIENPTQYAKLYADATSNCMFCSRELTDPQSVVVGYGPICAGHYGLPHGDIETEIASELAQIEMPMPEIKLPLNSITKSDNDSLPFFDITAPKYGVQIEIREDQSVVWISVDSQTILRICRIPKLIIENRSE